MAIVITSVASIANPDAGYEPHEYTVDVVVNPADFTREEMRGVETIKRDIARHCGAGVNKNFARARVKEVVAMIDRLTHVWILQSGNEKLHTELEEEYERTLEEEEGDGGVARSRSKSAGTRGRKLTS